MKRKALEPLEAVPRKLLKLELEKPWRAQKGVFKKKIIKDLKHLEAPFEKLKLETSVSESIAQNQEDIHEEEQGEEVLAQKLEQKIQKKFRTQKMEEEQQRTERTQEGRKRQDSRKKQWKRKAIDSLREKQVNKAKAALPRKQSRSQASVGKRKICTTKNCLRSHHAKGKCKKCYRRKLVNNCHCGNKHYAKGFCQKKKQKTKN